MGVMIDHVGLPATDPERAANFLRYVLGTGSVIPDGPPDDDSGDMYSLVLDGWSLAYVRSTAPAPHHLAIRADNTTFAGALELLAARGLRYENDPEDTTNGRADDPLGGRGRVYFVDPDGHLYELVVEGGFP